VLNYEEFRAAQVHTEPFRYVVTPGFLAPDDAGAAIIDFPTTGRSAMALWRSRRWLPAQLFNQRLRGQISLDSLINFYCVCNRHKATVPTAGPHGRFRGNNRHRKGTLNRSILTQSGHVVLVPFRPDWTNGSRPAPNSPSFSAKSSSAKNGLAHEIPDTPACHRQGARHLLTFIIVR